MPAVPRVANGNGENETLFLNGLRSLLVAAPRAGVYAGCIGARSTASAKKRERGSHVRIADHPRRDRDRVDTRLPPHAGGGVDGGIRRGTRRGDGLAALAAAGDRGAVGSVDRRGDTV